MSRIIPIAVFACWLLSGTAQAQDATAAINGKLTPILVKGTTFPYSSGELDKAPTTRVTLKTVSRTGNDIIDEDRWFRDNMLPRPGGPKDEQWRQVPGDTRWGELKFFRSSGDRHVGIYEATRPRTAAEDKQGLASIYDKEFTYTAVLFNADFAPQKLFVLEEFHPFILEMSDAHLSDSILYFDCNYNGYSNIAKNKTGYLVALDLDKEKVLWTSRPLTSSYRGFIVMADAIITGYGFTNEKDALYVLNRYTGKQWAKYKLHTAPDYIIPKEGKLYVRTYNRNYVFDIVEKKPKK